MNAIRRWSRSTDQIRFFSAFDQSLEMRYRLCALFGLFWGLATPATLLALEVETGPASAISRLVMQATRKALLNSD